MEQMLTKPSDVDSLLSVSNHDSTSPDEADSETDAATKPSNVMASSSSKPSEASLQSDSAAEATTDGFATKVQDIKSINIKVPADKAMPNITGMCFMPEGQLVLCDNANLCIKLLDRNLSVKDTLMLPGSPQDVAVIKTDSVVVTIPVRKQLCFIRVVPFLEQYWAMSIDKKCWGIDVAGDDIYVTCYTYGKDDGEVRVYGKAGNLKKKLGVRKDGSFMFRYPDYVVVSRACDRIFVSDIYGDTVYCITSDGKTVFRYTDKELSKPRGLYVDDKNNLVVCSRLGFQVQVISGAGKKLKTLLSAWDGVPYPETVTFRSTDGTLVVSNETSDKLFVGTLV